MDGSGTILDATNRVVFHGKRAVKEAIPTLGYRYNSRFLWMVCLVFGPPALSVTYMLYAQQTPFWVFIPMVLVAGVISGIGLYFMLALVHDIAHGLLPEKARLARLVDYVVHPLLGASTPVYQRAHLLHHSKLGILGSDPQFIPYYATGDDEPVGGDENVVAQDVTIVPPTWARFRLYSQSVSRMLQERDITLFKSLVSNDQKSKLYDKLSFFGAPPTNEINSGVALPEKYLKKLRQLDYLRMAFLTFLGAAVVSTFVSPVGLVVALQFVLASIVTASLNTLRISLEHSGAVGDGDGKAYNSQHTSNTAGGRNPFLRIVWYPAPWHAIHHAAPFVPFFMLEEIYKRCRQEQEQALA